MAKEPEKTIQSEYAQRYADHIAANRAEQTELTERLEQLKADEDWLVQQLAAATSAASTAPAGDGGKESPASTKGVRKPSAPAEAEADASSAVPQPRQDTQAAPSKPAARKKPASKGKAPVKRAPAKKTVAKKASSTAATDSAAAATKPEPPLHELVLAILLKTPGQPFVASEVADQLAQEHPGRATSVQTVRNNLETLVNKKKLAEKSLQQGSAMYTAYADAGAAAGANGPARGNTAQAPGNEKVPAEV